ncbi:MAG TPA: hypothetical protein VF773_12630 [Verrucomicrobiae bacterium]
MNTIRHLLHRRVVSDQSAKWIVFGCLTSTSLLVMILGIRRLAELELTEAQILFGATGIMTLAAMFIILALLVVPPFRNLKHQV